MKESKIIYLAVIVVVISLGVGGVYAFKNKNNGVKGVSIQNQQEEPVEENEPQVSADTIGPNETKLTDATIGDFISSNKFVLVDFYLSTCPHCKVAAPIVTDFANVYSDKVKVGKIEVRENPNVAETYQIDSVPQFFLFKDGKKVDSLSGSNVTVESFKALVDKYSK